MVQCAEQDRSEAVRQTAVLQQQQAEVHEEDIRNHLQKLKQLEQEHYKLTATQNIAEVGNILSDISILFCIEY